MKAGLCSLTEVLIGSLFLFTGISKLVGLQHFHDSLVNIPMINGMTAGFITLVIPNLEATLGMCLLFGCTSTQIRFLTFILLLSFCALSLYWLGHGMRTDCGCAGSLQLIGRNAFLVFIRNVALTIIALGLFYFQTQLERKVQR